MTKLKEAFSNNKNYMIINEVYAYISSDENGEGIIGKELIIHGKPVFMPFVMADKARLESLKPHAEEIAKFSNKKIKLIRFTHRTDIEEINP